MLHWSVQERFLPTMRSFSRFFCLFLSFFLLVAGQLSAIEWKPLKLSSHEKEARLLFSFLEARPNNPDLLQKIGKLYEADGNTEEAILWYGKAAEASPTRERLSVLAERFGWVNQPQNMLKVLKRLRALDPRDRDIVKRIAEVAGWANDPVTAGASFEAAFPLFRDPELLRKAIDNYLAAKQPEKAQRVLNRLIKIQPREPRNFELLADILEYQKDLPGSIEAYRKAFRLKPRVEILLKIAERLAWNNKPAEAALACQDILARSPRHTEARLLLAEVLEAGGSRAEAGAILETFKPKQLDERRRLLRAQVRLETSNFSGALEDASTLLRSPQRNRALLLSGEAARGLGDTNRAKGFLMELLQRSARKARSAPPTPEERQAAIRLLAGIARSAGNLVEEEHWLNLLEQEGDQDPYLLPSLADIARRRGANAEAITYLERSLEVASTPFEIRRTLGELLLEAKEFGRALPHLEASLKADEENAYLQELVLQCKHALGDPSGQLPLLWEAYRRDPDRTRLDRLVEILVQLGFKEKAFELLMAEFRRDPFDQTLEKRLKELSEGIPAWEARMESLKPALVERLYDEMVASATRAIASAPGNLEARLKRADVQLWRDRPKEALKDLMEARRRKPGDRNLLRKAASVAEWASSKKDAFSLRRELHEIAPEDATNTLRLAQELGWAGKLRQALPYYEKSRRDTGISAINRDQSAIPILAAVGRFRQAKRLQEELRARRREMNASQALLLAASEKHLHEYVGPSSSLHFSNNRSTDGVAHSQSEVSGRALVRNGGFLGYELISHVFSKDRPNQRSFRGDILHLAFNRQDDSPNVAGLHLRMSRDLNRGVARVLLPGLSYQWRRNARDTRLEFADEPVLDTPEAATRGIAFRVLRLAHSWPLKGRTRGILNAEYGRYAHNSDYDQRFAVGFEHPFSRNPRKSLPLFSYRYSRHQSGQQGGEVYYSPEDIRSHEVRLIGENRIGIGTLGWDAVYAIEEARAKIYGAGMRLFRDFGRHWRAGIDASLLRSTTGRFGGGKYAQWNVGGFLEWRGW